MNNHQSQCNFWKLQVTSKYNQQVALQSQTLHTKLIMDRNAVSSWRQPVGALLYAHKVKSVIKSSPVNIVAYAAALILTSLPLYPYPLSIEKHEETKRPQSPQESPVPLIKIFTDSPARDSSLLALFFARFEPITRKFRNSLMCLASR